MKYLAKKAVEEYIINITIPEFGQVATPEQEIERRGYERARGMYAEAKVKAIRYIQGL